MLSYVILIIEIYITKVTEFPCQLHYNELSDFQPCPFWSLLSFIVIILMLLQNIFQLQEIYEQDFQQRCIYDSLQIIK